MCVKINTYECMCVCKVVVAHKFACSVSCIMLDFQSTGVGDFISSCLQPIKLEVNEEKNLLVKFDPSYRNDLNNWVAEEVLSVKYVEHPQVDNLSLRGEVHYPNLSFEMMEVDFGCILNDTEVIRYITITNCSPLVVKFRWFFLVDDDENQIRYVLPRKPTDPHCSHSLFAAFPWVNCGLCTGLS